MIENIIRLWYYYISILGGNNMQESLKNELNNADLNIVISLSNDLKNCVERLKKIEMTEEEVKAFELEERHKKRKEKNKKDGEDNG